MTRKVFIGIPCLGQVMVSTVISLIDAVKEIHEAGWGYPEIYFRVGDSDLARARNAIVHYFLRSDCTDLLMIDSDISWPSGTIKRIVEHSQDFVAAAYRGRTDDVEMYFIQWPDTKEMWIDPATGNPLLKVNGVSIGFCRLTRSCVEKLVASAGEHTYMDPSLPDEDLAWVIDFERHDGCRLEEGYSLSKRWRNLGGDVWVDPLINLSHMGPKVFTGNLMDYLDRMRSLALTDALANRGTGNGATHAGGFPPQLMGDHGAPLSP